MSLTNAVLVRFAKGFVAGGLSSTLILLQSGNPFSVYAFLIAFLTGGLMAIEKYITWIDITPDVTPDTTTDTSAI